MSRAMRPMGARECMRNWSEQRVRVGKNRVAKLMRAENIQSRRKRGAKAPQIAVTTTQLHLICSSRTSKQLPRTKNGSQISPTFRPKKDGCIWLPSWISSENRRLGDGRSYGERIG